MDLVAYIAAAIGAVWLTLAGILFASHRDAAIWIGFGGVGIVTFAIFAFAQDWFWKADASSNKLLPGVSATPDYSQLVIEGIELPDNPLLIFLGQNVACVGAFPYNVICQSGEPMLTLNTVDGELLLSCRIFDANGKILCELVDNKFTVNPNLVFRLERPSLDRLIIIDDESREALNVQYINAHSVRISGDFHLRRGIRIHIGNDVMRFSTPLDEISIVRPVLFLSNLGDFGIDVDEKSRDGIPIDLTLNGAVVPKGVIQWRNSPATKSPLP